MEKKWFWMMNYCFKHRFPPAQKWAWDKAKEEYDKFNRKKEKRINEL